MKDAIWRAYAMKAGETRQWLIGETLFFAGRDATEWRVARESASSFSVDGAPDAAAKEPNWQRWPAPPQWDALTLKPAMPDRPLVARPANPVQLAPGCEASFYVGVPVWVTLLAGTHADIPLLDAPSIVLSNIWLGDPTEGELCYSLKTRAQRADMPDAANSPHRAVCKMRMVNAGDKTVEFLRLCLQAGHLNVYNGREHLWTDSVEATFERGSEGAVLVKVVGRPEEATDAAPLTASRMPTPQGSFWQKGLGRVKAWI